jgi:DMSO reductase anchor subunit
MHPAYSVILFTSASGAGYGLLIWLALAWLGLFHAPQPWIAFGASVLALVLVTTGLLASTFHLGHPERAWRAFSQWRSSWLSREGVFAVATYPVAMVFAVAWVWDGIPPSWVSASAVLLCMFCLLTVMATGMIYASLKTIPRWSNGYVAPVYLLFALSSGGLLYLLASSLSNTPGMALVVMPVILLAWAVKWLYWRFIDTQKSQSDTGTATGLGHLGTVRQLDAPHTSDNYLLQEMGYVVARKHSQKLRRMALIAGLLLPVLLIMVATYTAGLAGNILLLLAVVSGITGIVIERWLFFAEARHAVTLFYGRSL